MTQTNKTISLEEGISRSIPSRAFQRGLLSKLESDEEGCFEKEDLQYVDKQTKEIVLDFFQTNPGYYEVSKSHRIEALETLGLKIQHSDYIASLKVNLDNFLEKYSELLENQSKIYDYTKLLNPEIKELVLNGSKDENQILSKESMLIKHLFGISDHSSLNMQGKDHLKISNYIKTEIIESMFDVSANICSCYGAYMRGTQKTLRINDVSPFIENKPYNAIEFGSEFQLPTSDSAKNQYAFEGLTKIISKLKDCPEITGIQFDLGDYPCILPTWSRDMQKGE